jgi:hypothetical protein
MRSKGFHELRHIGERGHHARDRPTPAAEPFVFGAVNLTQGCQRARPLRGTWLRLLSPTRQVAAWVLAVAGPALVTLAALELRSSLVLGGFLYCTLLCRTISAQSSTLNTRFLPRSVQARGLGEAGQFSVAARWSVLGCRRHTLIASPDGGAAGGIYRFTRALVVVCEGLPPPTVAMSACS